MEIERFIPAPAGNSLSIGSRSTLPSVHPRACGEQMVIQRFGSPPTGSSPRLRGTVDSHGLELGRHRFIPAPAGNSNKARFSVSRETVHPRACGEQLHDDVTTEVTAGSSPRLRGTGGDVRSVNQDVRFIPAPAGNSMTLHLANSACSVHPRACGEQFLPRPNRPLIPGSSPRLRGTGQ